MAGSVNRGAGSAGGGMNIVLKLGSPCPERDFDAALRRLRGVARSVEWAAGDAVVADEPDVALAAAGDGCHVLLHDLEPDHVAAVEQACGLAGTTFMPAHAWRFRPSVREVIRSHRAGELGVPGLVRIHRWSGEASSGIRAAAIVPEIDVILGVFGASEESVHAVSRGDDFLQVHLGFADGGMALADFAWGVPGSYRSLCLIGSTGAAYADDHHNMNLLLAAGFVRAINVGQGAIEVHGLLAEFVEAVREGREPAVTAVDTRSAFATARAAVNAARVAGEVR